MDAELRALLQSIERRLEVIEQELLNRSAPAPEVHQALDDVLRTYGLAGQIAEVVRGQRDQIQALVDAYDRLSLSLTEHHDHSTGDRHEIKQLLAAIDLTLGSFVEVVRHIVHLSTDIARAVGAGVTPAERSIKALRDVRPEES